MPPLLRFIAFCHQRFFVGIPDITIKNNAQCEQRIFIRRSENRNDIVFTFAGRERGREGDILLPAVREQLRSLRVNRRKNFSDQREIYRWNGSTLPEIEDFEDPQARASFAAKIYLRF